MQENNPIPTPEVTTPVIVDQPKQSNFLIILLSILLLISIAISGFFAYQTQELVKELNKLKPIEKTVTEDISEPVATESSEIDPTADWKTYENKQLGFSLRMPDNWNASLETKTETIDSSVLSISGGEYKLVFNTTMAGYGGIICDFVDSTDDQFAGPGIDDLRDPMVLEGTFGKKIRRNKNQIMSLSQYGYQRNQLDYSFRVCQILDNVGSDGKSGYSGTFDTKSGTTEILYYTPASNIKPEELNKLDQILSTFKFTN
ncbi:MAG: hypothetical protein WA152_03255 [Microgenomates group bacterium]